MLRVSCAMAALLFATACATGAKRDIETGLADIGFPEKGSACFASELDDRLSAEELRRVADLIEATQERSEFFSAVRGAGSPQIAAAVAAAGLACAFPQS
ncbi:MAG: hypothetical protein AAGC95_07165 [Pseudomonadota bacterium]